MSRRSACCIAFLIAAASPAAADQGQAHDAPASAVQTSSGDRRLGPFTRDTYPSELLYRPLTLPAGLWRVQAGGVGSWLGLLPGGSFGLSGLAAGAYGLTDRLELSAGAALESIPVARLDSVAAGATYLWVDSEAVDVAARLEVEVTQLAPFLGLNVHLGLPGRILVTDGLFLTFGDRLLQLSTIGSPIFPALQLGAGLQVAGGAAVLLGTDLFLALYNSSRAMATSFPLDLRVAVALSRALDLDVRLHTANIFRPLLFASASVGVALYL
jgi:hypothetical protein